MVTFIISGITQPGTSKSSQRITLQGQDRVKVEQGVLTADAEM
jgi:hypothetical protein